MTWRSVAQPLSSMAVQRTVIPKVLCINVAGMGIDLS
jgi:hypothetical protein